VTAGINVGVRDSLGGLRIGRSRVPVAGPSIVLGEPEGAKREDRFHTRDAPELLGPFHPFVEQLHGGFRDARADRPAFSSIRRVIHVVSMGREVTHVVCQHPARMFWDVSGLRRTQAIGMTLQRDDHFTHLAGPQLILQLLSQRLRLRCIFSQGGPCRFVQMLKG